MVVPVELIVLLGPQHNRDLLPKKIKIAKYSLVFHFVILFPNLGELLGNENDKQCDLAID